MSPNLTSLRFSKFAEQSGTDQRLMLPISLPRSLLILVLLLPRRSTLGAMLQYLALMISLEAVVCLLEVALVLPEVPLICLLEVALILAILVVRMEVNLVVVLPLIMAEANSHVVVDLGTLGAVVGVVVEV